MLFGLIWGLALVGMIIDSLPNRGRRLIPLAIYGQPDYGPIVGGYLGTFAFGAMFLAIGLAVSAACTNQVVAALITVLSIAVL